MAPYYQYLCDQLKWNVDSSLLQKMKTANDKKLEELAAKQASAESNEGESEIRDIMEERANYLTKIGDKV
jgi:26S proteasome regulatory subunit N7